MTSSIPFQVRSGLVVVPVQVTGPTGETLARLAIDTGATTTMLSESVLIVVGCRLKGPSKKVVMMTAGGLALAKRVTVRKMAVAGHSRRAVSVICHSLPPGVEIDGLLGLDFFKNRVFTLDFRRQQLSLS